MLKKTILVRSLGRSLLAAPPLIFLGLLVLWPLIAVLRRSLGESSAAQIVDILNRPALIRVGWFTLWQALVSAALTTIIGLPIAHVLGRYQFRGKAVVRSAFVVPFVLPTVVVAAAIRSSFDRIGVDPSHTLVAVLAAHVFFNVAVIVRIVGGFWATLDNRQVEAAQVLGAKPFEAWRTITFRQLMPVIVGAMLLVFLFSFTSFGVIRVLGGLRTATIETEIFRYAISRQEFDVAAVLSLVQIAAVSIMALASSVFQRRHSVVSKGTGALTSVSAWRHKIHLGSVIAIAAVVFGTPVGILVEQSLRGANGYGLANYRALFTRVDLLPVSAIGALTNSFFFAAIAAGLAIVVGLAASITVVRGGRVGRALEAFTLLPLGISAVTLGFGYLLGFAIFDLRRSLWLVPISHAVIGLPFVMASTVPALRSTDARVRQAAATLGASPIRAWFTVDWPRARGGLAAGGGLAAAVSIGEFGATSFLARGADSFTAPLAIFRLLGVPGPQLRGQALALSVVVGLLVATLAAIIEWRRADGLSLL